MTDFFTCMVVKEVEKAEVDNFQIDHFIIVSFGDCGECFEKILNDNIRFKKQYILPKIIASKTSTLSPKCFAKISSDNLLGFIVGYVNIFIDFYYWA